ncbi:MAG TPA: hypothetical protein PK109_00625 [Candidatus Paceibacterota bacterium]|nr:hypothetical protein [Candidatus Paceibacterota bacterium]
MKEMNEGWESSARNVQRIEQIISQPIVEEQIALHVRNIREILLTSNSRNAESDSKIGKVLEDYARLIAMKFEQVKDIEPIASSDPNLAETLSSKTFPIAKKYLEALMDGKFLAERLSDDMGTSKDWLNEEAESVLAMIAVNIMHDTLVVAYCLRLGIDPERLRTSSAT